MVESTDFGHLHHGEQKGHPQGVTHFTGGHFFWEVNSWIYSGWLVGWSVGWLENVNLEDAMHQVSGGFL